MISFSCPQCGLKLKVKPEFAGRKSSCPTCKQPLTVPVPEETQAYVPAAQIEGTASSVEQAGLEGGVTLEQDRGAGAGKRASGRKSVQELLAQRPKHSGRYVVEGEIARGGMGTVLRAVDCDLRREVAVKFMLDDKDAKKKVRFIEEAQITGQLAHPNIVPIYELGVDSRKRLFFSMKKVEGRSLAQVLDLLRKPPGERRGSPTDNASNYPLTRLLTILTNVCNGLAFAHSRGVVHRDLKPANIMVGDFGEVYVMDWGLAKVRGQESQGRSQESIRNPQAASAPKVSTSREPDADLTQEGAVLGTPVYMPPEQAAGKLNEIDQRSDVYSLGAILYEILTLEPPVEKEGGYLAILMRVVQGEVVAPAQRTPDRAKKCLISKELSAIAMKALAKEPKERYPTVEALRRDLERFQEGRSVSAKPDTVREFAWKLVKRNKAVSAIATVALVALLVLWGQMSWANYQERTERFRQARKSVPAFVRAARLSMNEKRFDDALAQVNIALEYEPEDVDGLLVKGKVLIVKKQFRAAKVELERCYGVQPSNQTSRQLADLCGQASADDPRTLIPFVDLFLRDKDYALAEAMGEFGDKLFAAYRQQIKASWPGLEQRLTMDGDGKFRLNLEECGAQVKDLVALRGIPLTSLNLRQCIDLRDVMPLRGMPLTSLNLRNCSKIPDIRPLQGMPLVELDLHGLQIRDLTPLKGMKLTYLHLGYCGGIQNLSPLQGMPLTWLAIYATDARDLTPLEGMSLREIILSPAKIGRGMEVLRRMKSLNNIWSGPDPASQRFTAQEFWKKYDAGEFSK